jgi:hypothetical protein
MICPYNRMKSTYLGLQFLRALKSVGYLEINGVWLMEIKKENK